MHDIEKETLTGHVLVLGGSKEECPEVIEYRSFMGKTYQIGHNKFVHLGKHEYQHYEKDGKFYDIDLSDANNIKAPYLVTRTVGIGYKFQARGQNDTEITVQMLGVPEKLSPDFKDGGVVYYTDVDIDLDVYMKPQNSRYGLYKVIKSSKAPRVFQFEIDWGKSPVSFLTTSGIVETGDSGLKSDQEIDNLLSLDFGEIIIPTCKAWDRQGVGIEVLRSIKGDILKEQVILPEGFDRYPVTLDIDTELKPTSGSWNCPDGVTEVLVECWGGGGSGGSGTVRRYGGGGGAFASSSIAVIAGQTYSYVVAGHASPSRENKIGDPGEDTYWGTSAVKAVGGKAGFTSGGAGGLATACVGTVRYSGGAGNYAGGGGAGSTGNGKNASTTTGGGATFAHGGAGADAPTESYWEGNNGSNYGGAGSGAWGVSYVYMGGNGAPGLIRLTYERILVILSSQPASDVTDNKATLNGYVVMGPGTAVSCWFEWGKTTSYGNETVHTYCIEGQTFSDHLIGLDPNTTYHYRPVSQYDGDYYYGPDQEFTTLLTAPVLFAEAIEGAIRLTWEVG